jgi:hypothetical protein
MKWRTNVVYVCFNKKMLALNTAVDISCWVFIPYMVGWAGFCVHYFHTEQDICTQTARNMKQRKATRQREKE